MNNKKERVLVTGASKGIGKAVAECLGKSGYEIVVHFGNDQEGALNTQNNIKEAGGCAQILSFDVTNREECCEKLVADMEKNGAYYGIVSNAGIALDTAFPAMTDSDWDRVIDTNLNGFYNVVRPCVMPMIKRRAAGRIIAMTSVSGITGNKGQVNYSASKSAIIGAVKSLAIELAKREITVNCVAPGLIETGMISEEVWQHAKALIPMQRMGKVEEVASLVKYLIGKEASYITRQVISMNGGMV